MVPPGVVAMPSPLVVISSRPRLLYRITVQIPAGDADAIGDAYWRWRCMT